MIYLIGGSPRVGKSIIAKSVAKKQKTEIISTDDVCEDYFKHLSDEEKKAKFPLPSFSGNASENTLKPEEWVDLQIISAKSLETELSRIISEAIAEDKTVVIEGVHLLPEYVSSILAKYGSDKIRALCIGLTDVDQAVEGIMRNTNPDNWMRESNSDVVRQVAESIVAFSVRIQEDAMRNHLPYKERTEDFEGDVISISEYLLKDAD